MFFFILPHSISPSVLSLPLSPTDQPPLPDVILSNTPPPSPLRRTRSCHAFFPDTPPPSPLQPPTPPLTQGSPGVGEGATRGEGEHFEQVRRHVEGGEPSLPRSPDLPQLSWPLPSPRRPQAPREEEEGDEEEQQQRRWRCMGSDLRKIADQFQLSHSEVSRVPPYLRFLYYSMEDLFSFCPLCVRGKKIKRR